MHIVCIDCIERIIFVIHKKYELENIDRINEDIFKESVLIETMANAPMLRKVDEYFDELIDMISFKHSDEVKNQIDVTRMTSNPEWETKLLNIVKIINRLFNIDLTFRMDPANALKPPTYFAATEIPSVSVKVLSAKILEDGEGYHFYKIKKMVIFLQESFFVYCKRSKLRGRTITSVLLHEIGHHVFLKVNTKINNSRTKLEIVVNGVTIVSSSLTFIVSLLSVFSKSSNEKNAPLATVKVISMIIDFLSVQLSVYLAKNSLRYVEIESNCDSMSVKYGYGKEIFELFAYLAGPGDKFKEKRNWYLQRIDNITKMIDDEIKDPTNSPVNIKRLKQTKKEIIDIEKKRVNGSLKLTSIDEIIKSEKLINSLGSNTSPFVMMFKKIFSILKGNKNKNLISYDEDLMEEMEILFRGNYSYADELNIVFNEVEKAKR